MLFMLCIGVCMLYCVTSVRSTVRGRVAQLRGVHVPIGCNMKLWRLG